MFGRGPSDGENVFCNAFPNLRTAAIAVGMFRAWPCWRGLGIALLSGFLLLFTLGPGLQNLVCADGAASASAAHQFSDTSTDQTPIGDIDPGAAVHAHCDHGGVSNLALASVSVALIPSGDRRAMDRSRVASTNRQFGLERPPRA